MVKILVTLKEVRPVLNCCESDISWKICFWPIIDFIKGGIVYLSEVAIVAKYCAGKWTSSCANLPKTVKDAMPDSS